MAAVMRRFIARILNRPHTSIRAGDITMLTLDQIMSRLAGQKGT